MSTVIIIGQHLRLYPRLLDCEAARDKKLKQQCGRGGVASCVVSAGVSSSRGSTSESFPASNTRACSLLGAIVIGPVSSCLESESSIYLVCPVEETNGVK